ncbi:DUF4870 domain-containing protein [Curtobacterium sp. 458]|uniref:DUF4870 domain-containing protein n=1 Tax=Curtobacterium sp. 458 TaxID=3050069 RepID=UPI0025B5394C|nr:DUF4870 domain-containing protein [Curtobacterium sp. 458]WJX99702.1 DUF4870 domain-containing protein [Curtobacterium sp. 458]
MTHGQQPGGPGGPQYPPNYQAPQPMSPEDQRLWATLTHVGAIFFSLLVPIVAYLVLRDRGQFVREHTRQALNFHITAAIAGVVCGLLSIILIGLILLPILGVLVIVFSILAAIAANQGRFYKYPLSIEFIKQ